jgi:hypothetical protein
MSIEVFEYNEANGLRVRGTGKENSFTPVGQSMKENGKTTRSMEAVDILARMAESMMEYSIMTEL